MRENFGFSKMFVIVQILRNFALQIIHVAAVTVLADIYNVNRNLIDSGKYVHRRNEGTGKKKCRFF